MSICLFHLRSSLALGLLAALLLAGCVPLPRPAPPPPRAPETGREAPEVKEPPAAKEEPQEPAVRKEPAVKEAPAQEKEAPAAVPPAKESPAVALERARGLLGRGEYRQAVAEAEKIGPGDGEWREARQVRNASYYALGRELEKAGKYPKALEAYGQVDVGYRDVGAAMQALKQRMEEESEKYYLEGVQFFVDQKLDQAITLWEKALAVNPGHPRAAKDLEKARKLSEELQKVR